MAPFLGGMRGLTVFVQDVRNCANKVRRERRVSKGVGIGGHVIDRDDDDE